MPRVLKWIITIIVVLFAAYVYFGLDKRIVPYWIAPLFALPLFGVWIMRDPNENKKEVSVRVRNKKRRNENIFLLLIVAVIILMLVLKFSIP